MNYQDTVLDNTELFMNYYHDGPNPEQEGADIEKFIKSRDGRSAIEIAEAQAKASWDKAVKAGRQEAVDFINLFKGNIYSEEWKAKIKEWGIE